MRPPEARDVIQEANAAALAAVIPDACLRRAMRCDGSRLIIGERIVDIASYREVVVVGIGKASARMAVVLESILGGCDSIRGRRCS
jgi:glycerate 2-kinase